MPTIPYTKNTTWADGSGGGTPDTAAKKNIIEAGIYEAHLMPTVRAYNSGTQALTTATEAALSFNTEIYDQVAGAASTQHDTVTNNSRFTCLYAGVYLCTANVDFAANATGQRFIAFRVNATASQYLYLARSHANSGTYTTTLNISGGIALAVNDYVQVIAYQDSGGNLNVSAGTSSAPFNCEFSWQRVG